MITEIGIIAGEIWHFLEKKGKVSLKKLVKGIDRDEKLVLMSLGWLAREGHVVIEKKGAYYRVRLRKGK
ncbi:MAG: hypothetical protein DRP68_04820 [Candidatus Omnitrophota bacterium]|nr:winged helix-turn-helix domain-containing protein [Candidatus Omnitrophota bacterium]RKY31537.1 MAG: hypothetical protein DRP68_04820 [Candidatus Omnitrophota bacterium]RKY38632.1 MAG: hypothetical protein DRP72_01445 [Candidatus Omnitrophota bacterium]RKY46303.1 MAG: hypothetical protein DRP81_01070 [Candidatus Omnitrophota bacterium]HDN85862.1 hypothetical protein [Candidatus Omnitrophota bacterium]